jgi:hypothetical protein
VIKVVFFGVSALLSFYLAGFQGQAFASYLVDTPSGQNFTEETPKDVPPSTEVTLHLEKKMPESMGEVATSSDVSPTYQVPIIRLDSGRFENFENLS